MTILLFLVGSIIVEFVMLGVILVVSIMDGR